ncbi:MAG TPA: hypothetical protein VHC94_17000 [Nitrobacter sp.]|nr:hypothetical protein [Nitrobacter sp.]
MSPAPDAAPPTEAEAAQLVERLTEAIVRLEGLLQEETRLVRAARLGEAAAIAERKTAAATLYERELAALRAAAGVILRAMPERAGALRQRLAGLNDTLAVNLAVLGTAKAVTEDMMRSVAAEVGRRSRPALYGAGGRTAGYGTAPTPLRLSRRS